MKKELYIGVMSGTSMDGVDVVLCEIDAEHCELKAQYEHPFPNDLKSEILKMIAQPVTFEKVGSIDHRLGLLFAEAIKGLLSHTETPPKAIVAVGLHGQTVWHIPEGEPPFSMQMGDPNLTVVHTGMCVVADFRRKDIALGGNGAPFAPAFHEFIFKNIKKDFVLANIGGIANITVPGEVLLGYDTGPGNMLMDMWIWKHKKYLYDKNGVWARTGKVIYPLLDTMLEDAYFSALPPKSTGREYFNLQWLDAILCTDYTSSSAVDIQRTLLELTARSLSNEVLKFNPDILMLCGGGANNAFLVERIKALIPNAEVEIMEQGDWIEAMMMAWLAYKRIHEEAVPLKEVTGAKENTVLGCVYI